MHKGWSDRQERDDDRLGSGNGSSSRPRSPSQKPRLERDRSLGHINRRERSPSEQHRIDRNRVDKVVTYHPDGEDYDRIKAQSREAQARKLEREKKRQQRREESSADDDAFERLGRKSKDHLTGEQNGSGSREADSGPRSSRKDESKERYEEKGHSSQNGHANGQSLSRSGRDGGSRTSGEYERRDDTKARRENSRRDEDRRRRRRYEENRSLNKEKESWSYSDSDPGGNGYKNSNNRDHNDRYDNNGYSNDGYTHDRYRYERYRDERHRDDRRRVERHRDERHRDERHRDDRYHERKSDFYSRGTVDYREENANRRQSSSHRHSRSSSYRPPHDLVNVDGAPEACTAESSHSRSERHDDTPAPPLESKSAIPTPPPPSIPPKELSFKPVLLPHELIKPENASLLPTYGVNGKPLMPYQVTFDPDLFKSKSKGRGVTKEVTTKTEVDSNMVDPRKEVGKRSVRDRVVTVKWKWDIHSTKPKPLAPSCAVLVTGASPMMTVGKVKSHFQTFGKIDDVENKLDQLGQSLGIFSIRYTQDYGDDFKLKPDTKNGASQRGDLVASAAVRESEGKAIYGESMSVLLDDNNKTQFLKIYKEEMAKRMAPKPKAVQAFPVTPLMSLPGSPLVAGVNMPPPETPKGPRNPALPSQVMASTLVVAQSAPLVASFSIEPKYSLGRNNRVQEAALTHSNSRADTSRRGVFLRQAQTWSSSPHTSPAKAFIKRPAKTTWSDKELYDDARLLILRELGESFMRDIKTKVISPFLKGFMKPEATGGQAVRPPVVAEVEDSESEVEIKRPKGRRRRIVVEEERERVGVTPESTELSEKSPSDDEGTSIAAESIAGEVQKVVCKSGKKMKKTKMSEMDDVEEVAAENGEEAIAAATIRVKAKKTVVKKVKEQSPVANPISLGLAEDEEDLYYLKLVLEKVKSGMTLAEIQAQQMQALELAQAAETESAVGVNGLPRHASGSARTEGVYRIAPAQKAVHMPDRNRAVVDPSSVVGFTSARGNRADSRRFVQGIEQHKKETATDTDILKFNQLRSRKKQLKFSKSPIHDWGLYAVELIPAGDMVIEYVGEIVRQQVADQREKMYERQGNFSTYLFRVDDDVVVDATKKGNIARLMNHCCTPNCNAKILTLNGEKRIVLFAQKTILPGQELTYDYKFQATGDEEDAIACLCGSPGCRRFL